MRTVLLLIFAMLSIVGSAQSIEKRYRSSKCENGILHFFRPFKLTEVENMNDFVYDMTYVTKADSVILNFTTEIKKPLNVIKFELKAENTIITNNTPLMLYRDVKKSSYELRVSVSLPYNDVERAFTSEETIMFIIYLSDGSVCKAAYSKSNWRKEKRIISRIMQSINI